MSHNECVDTSDCVVTLQKYHAPDSAELLCLESKCHLIEKNSRNVDHISLEVSILLSKCSCLCLVVLYIYLCIVNI